ncbi:ribosome small subunit-dependent GTPase A [Herbiconiux sp. KACC 21604]|uniref:ribosome small subunit-dependent GTPase A n=1 Tax=unclassified Herbiconiux TaxID=2618217 RepID=UPI00149100BA|nr:ribosome small subunit-dependent GTPase A [Herbiconiux sp. SALV-R1]QJU53829.1 ribosome small subunit-dependent GTPase A [Herbiconiux sp. SALV-R1]WPO84839.1 ribosome small subunit-dependent GTPase A [Herbiconiux sp. KACC 21604]
MSWWNDDSDDEDDDDFDESRVRVRPNPKGNRPRTKTRPDHKDAVAGRIMTVDRGRFAVLVGQDTDDEHEITASRARELGRTPIVTGDWVDLVGDTSGEPGTLARVVRVHERSTLLRRSADDSDAVERVIVANADQMLIVVAAANPEPRARLIDRYLVAAFDAGIEPVLCVTKTDLADPAPLLAEFACLDIRVVTLSRDAVPVDELTELLLGRTTVTVGHSGVGKSTLVNALVPDARRATGVVNTVTGRGRHTSSSTVCLRLHAPDGRTGWIIDTPGVRSFGLGHVDPQNILRSFAATAHVSEGDPPDGIPLAEAHDWEIVDRVQAGELGESGRARLESLQKLLESTA